VGISEGDTARTMLATLHDTGEMIDPHTAVAVAALGRAGDLGAPVVVLSTAHAAKFPEAVFAATGETPKVPGVAQALAGRPERFDRLPAEVDVVKDYVLAFAET